MNIKVKGRNNWICDCWVIMGWWEHQCLRCGKKKGTYNSPYYAEEYGNYREKPRKVKSPPRFRNEQEWCDYQYHLIKNGHRNN